MMFQKQDPVYVERCTQYDEEQIYRIFKNAVEKLGFLEAFRDKKVAIKPNLVRKMKPEQGGTTHPAVMKAAIKLVFELGAKEVTVAESPGGIYNASALKQIYEGCGMTSAVENTDAVLNFDVTCGSMKAPNGEKSKVFDVITPIKEADVVVNLSKLKSHGMLTQSCAAKNFFGIIPGVLKFEMHARFPKPEDFAGMLADINEMLHSEKTILNVCDGIVGMEGNGPTNGVPKKMDVLLFSANPFGIDLAAAKIVGIKTPPELLAEGIKRGYCPACAEDLLLAGEKPDDFVVTDFKEPDTGKSSMLKRFLTLNDGKYARFFEPRPVINKKKCRGCGECVKSCPQKTISWQIGKNGKRKAKIHKEKCIKCYCCQELCPFDSVKIHTNLLIKLANKL